MNLQSATPIEIVAAFLSEWAKSRAAIRAAFHEFCTPDIVWENVGMATTVGIDAAVSLLDQFEANYGVHTIVVDMINIGASDNLVFTERVDRLLNHDRNEVMSIRLMGIFELADGKIIGWRDYFDTAAIPAPSAK